MNQAVLLLSAQLRRMLTLWVSIPAFIVGTLVRSVHYSAIFEMYFFVPARLFNISTKLSYGTLFIFV